MASENENNQEYFLPTSLYLEWYGCELEGFVPNDRQRMVMQAQEAAVAAGHFYSEVVKKFAIDILKISDELKRRHKYKVHGGDVGYDIFFAGKAVRAAKHWKEIALATEALQPKVGMPLGTLRVNFKRTTKCVITKINGHELVVIGQRGHQVATFTADVLQLQNASIAAFEKGWRKGLLIKSE